VDIGNILSPRLLPGHPVKQTNNEGLLDKQCAAEFLVTTSDLAESVKEKT
jgi:hypothetical protein